MRTALCLIGSELTRGIIQDTHTKLLAPILESIGCEVERVVILPDDGNIGKVLQELINEAELIICTGGLGPTSDDITRDAAAEAAGVVLTEDPQALAELEQLIQRPAGRANRRQVMIPQGFQILSNPLGTAPGFWGSIGSTRLFCLPGPPAELERMLMQEVLPILSRQKGSGEKPFEVSVFLIPESNLEELCQEVFPDGITWATRTQALKISLYLRGGSRAEQEEALYRLQKRAGIHRVRKGNVDLADSFIETLRSKGKTCVFAESCTGGYLGKIITDRPGSSQVFWGSYVCYANEAKELMLGVKEQTLQRFGAVSAETAESMALGALVHSQADISCSITGIAGPDGGTEEKPVGTVWFSLAGKGREGATVSWKWSYPRRELVRRRAVIAALLMGEAYVNEEQVVDIVNEWQYI